MFDDDDQSDAAFDEFFTDWHDDLLAQQELEEFEQADEFFGYYGESGESDDW